MSALNVQRVTAPISKDGMTMPNGKQHALIGAIAGAIRSFHDEPNLRGRDRWFHLAGSVLGGIAGSKIPDWLEPATHPNHRQAAHGVLPNLALAKMTKPTRRYLRVKSKRWARQGEVPVQGQLARSNTDGISRDFRFLISGSISGFEAGYASHLVADAFTPKSLPLIGKL